MFQGQVISSDFVIDTLGYCFLCLSEIKTKPPPVKVDSKTVVVSPSTYSLHGLSRYLKMDMGKVIKDEFSVSPTLLAKVERSKLKVELCEGCVILTEKFSKFHGQLEKIEMEVASCVALINMKLMNAEETGKAERISEMNDDTGKLQFAKILRNEAIYKSSKKLSSIPPRIRCHDLNVESGSNLNRSLNVQGAFSNSEVNCNPSQPSFEAQPQSDIEIGIVKVECHSPPGSITNQDLQDDIEDKMTSKSTKRITGKPYKLDSLTGQYKCNLCPAEFPNYHQFLRHQKKIHLKAKYNCNICGKDFNFWESRKRHQQTVHMGLRFSCNICSRTFTKQHNLYSHQRTKSCGVGPGQVPASKYKCNHRGCGKEFTRSSDLKRHFNSIHFQLKEYECNQCGKKYQRRYQLNEHQRAVHLKSDVKMELDLNSN